MRILLWWWRQPDHYEWLSAYLKRNGMARVMRCGLSFTALALGLLAVAVQFSSGAPEGPVRIGLTVLGAVTGFSTGLLWLITFPTKAQSLAFAFVSTMAIGVSALAQRDPMSTMLVCTTLVCIAGYVALFHTAAIMTLNLAAVLVFSAVGAIELAARSGPMFAACAYGIVVVAHLFVPFGSQILFHSLGVDLDRAALDPLTGLLDRSAFYERTRRQLRTQEADTFLVVAMVDLDRFKQLNDTHGHAVGDRALVAVAEALRNSVDDDAVVARVGGEEFLVAGFTREPPPGTFAARLCTAIEHVPHPVTASIGTASSRCASICAQNDSTAALRVLVEAADLAMYAAKRSGGNQTRHDHDPFSEAASFEDA